MKQVGVAVSQERGTLVTVCGGINALGNHMPPYFVFPRVNTLDHWCYTAPTSSKVSDHPKATGWMTKENFMDYMNHFVVHAKPSVENPVLLLLDNHHTHVNLDIIDFAKKNHITMLSFPPHCSQKLQPLDKSEQWQYQTVLQTIYF